MTNLTYMRTVDDLLFQIPNMYLNLMDYHLYIKTVHCIKCGFKANAINLGQWWYGEAPCPICNEEKVICARLSTFGWELLDNPDIGLTAKQIEKVFAIHDLEEL